MKTRKITVAKEDMMNSSIKYMLLSYNANAEQAYSTKHSTTIISPSSIHTAVLLNGHALICIMVKTVRIGPFIQYASVTEYSPKATKTTSCCNSRISRRLNQYCLFPLNGPFLGLKYKLIVLNLTPPFVSTKKQDQIQWY